MKEYVKKVVAIILAIAAILSFAACGKKDTATDDMAQTTATTVTTSERDEVNVYVSVDFSAADEELQKQLLKLLPEDGEIFLQKDLTIERDDGVFYLDTPSSYPMYLGSADVPASEGGWDLSFEDKCHRLDNGGTVKFSEENKTVLQCWENQQLIWELDTEVEGLSVKEVRDNVIILADNYYYQGDRGLYIVHNQRIRQIGEDILDIDARYSDLWWLTIDGYVYKLEDFENNPQGEPKLLATDAIALSNNMSDGPGWYITGEASFSDDWSPVVGEFVPA